MGRLQWSVLCRSGLGDIAEGAQVRRVSCGEKQLQTRHITQKPGFRASKIDMFDVKHFRSLFDGHYDLPASRVRFCGFTGLIGSVEMDSVSSRRCGRAAVLAVRLRRCRRAGGFQDILQDFYVRSNVCLPWSIAYSDPIRFRGVCALVMYVFQTRRSELPLYALGVLCSR